MGEYVCMGIDFKRYYKLLGDEKITYKDGALPELVGIGLTNWQMLKGVKKILDIGCGNGFWANTLKNLKYNIYQCDINVETNGLENIYQCDMHNLEPFTNKEFDFVFCNGTFEHSLAPFILLCEINRVLEVGGLAFINYPKDDNSELLALPQHINILSYHAFVNLAIKTGFSIEKSAGVHGHMTFLLKKEKDIE